MNFNRIFLIVMDSLGIGELPDANEYGDLNTNTLGSIAKTCNGINMPTLEKMGIGNIEEIPFVNKVESPLAFVTKLGELSIGKDTMTGHWEMMGLKITEPFQTFTDTGFPDELLNELTKRTGRNIVGNKSASGTEILDELGEHHMKTGDLIVYTSADSVLQIAAHEEVIKPEELWEICEIAREITMKEEWKVGRIIARPFVGEGVGQFKRTSNRHDYALKPFGRTTLNALKDNNLDVISLGKINDIYDGEGITRAIKTVSNEDGMNKITELSNEEFKGLAFLNLVDFDALYGHRRDPKGYKEEIERFDEKLKILMENLKEDDLLILTADHGNDPTHVGSDHTREYVPLIMYSKKCKDIKQLEVGESFANIGCTIADNFGVEKPSIGKSFYTELR